jgi:hypothetical protein
LGPLKNCWKYFGSVEKTINKKLDLLKKLLNQTLCMLEKVWKNVWTIEKLL